MSLVNRSHVLLRNSNKSSRMLKHTDRQKAQPLTCTFTVTLSCTHQAIAQAIARSRKASWQQVARAFVLMPQAQRSRPQCPLPSRDPSVCEDWASAEVSRATLGECAQCARAASVLAAVRKDPN